MKVVYLLSRLHFMPQMFKFLILLLGSLVRLELNI
ncbi:hypothetical protein Gohar_003860 [Gossypium harknessii]|uniref:Uncharacterized protein n=1 Tax=Gossypium harknessii TaxID=34285 RepID=A0A7J9H346_9ROSI|nr:hypothetical protein [Gossypium harknessii]